MDFEYYIIDRAGDAPRVTAAEGDEHTMEYMYGHPDSAITEPETMRFTFIKPYTKSPAVGDYLSQPESVVSGKIRDALEQFNLRGVQFVPATVTGDAAVFCDLYYVHIFRHISALDFRKSRYKTPRGATYVIGALALDRAALAAIPPGDRLLFKLLEDPTKNLYHKSVADAVMATKPTGVAFVRAEAWRGREVLA
jgi:hypothetical protein